jgi:hypothetical protein
MISYSELEIVLDEFLAVKPVHVFQSPKKAQQAHDKLRKQQEDDANASISNGPLNPMKKDSFRRSVDRVE